jgi:uncharacterized membrane-anchored protein
VDPVDILRGRYVRLGYEIGQLDAMRKLPGWRDAYEKQPTDLYWVLEPGSPAWKAVAIAETPPTGERVALRGRLENGRVTFGLEQYYVPEDQGDVLQSAINRESHNLAEVRVDGWGHAMLTGVRVGDRRF